MAVGTANVSSPPVSRSGPALRSGVTLSESSGPVETLRARSAVRAHTTRTAELVPASAADESVLTEQDRVTRAPT